MSPSEPAAPGLRLRTVIEPGSAWGRAELVELWERREVLFFLIWRDLKVRYKQTALGVAWAILQPVVAAAIFTVVFGLLAKVPSDGVPYPLFAYVGLLPWQLFSHALTESTQAVVTNQQLIKKVYFPRLYLPLAPVIGGLVDFALAFLVLLVAMAALRVVPGPGVVLLPLLALFAAVTALAVGIWLAALNVHYRDVRYTVPFLVQVWFFATPIVYSSTLVPEGWRPLLGLNPMAGVVEGFRWALLRGAAPSIGLMALSAVVVVVLLTAGLLYFRRIEATMADVV